MERKSSKKHQKRRVKPPLNRRVAQLMIEIQDELRMIEPELKKTPNIEYKNLTKLIIKETRLCLNETLKIVQSK